MGDDGLLFTEVDGTLLQYLQETIDPDIFPTQVVTTVSYLDADGTERWASITAGGGRIPTAIGLLEFAKAWLVQSMYRQAADDLGDD